MLEADAPGNRFMTLVEFERRLAERLGLDAVEVSRVVRAALGLLVELLAAGEVVKLQGFGRFAVGTIAARRRKDPRNGRDIEAPAKARIVFRPSRLLLDRLRRSAER